MKLRSNILVWLFSCVSCEQVSDSAATSLLVLSLYCFDLSAANLFPTVLVFEKHNAVLLSFVCSERNICLSGLFYELADGDLNALEPVRALVL